MCFKTSRTLQVFFYVRIYIGHQLKGLKTQNKKTLILKAWNRNKMNLYREHLEVVVGFLPRSLSRKHPKAVSY